MKQFLVITPHLVDTLYAVYFEVVVNDGTLESVVNDMLRIFLTAGERIGLDEFVETCDVGNWWHHGDCAVVRLVDKQ